MHVCDVCDFFFLFLLGKVVLEELKFFVHSHLRNEHVHKFLFCFLVDTLLVYYPFFGDFPSREFLSSAFGNCAFIMVFKESSIVGYNS